MNKYSRAPPRGVSTTNSETNPSEIKEHPLNPPMEYVASLRSSEGNIFSTGKCSIYVTCEYCRPKPIMCYFKAQFFYIIIIKIITLIKNNINNNINNNYNNNSDKKVQQNRFELLNKTNLLDFQRN